MLWKSADGMRDGLLDADLGGHVVKKRIALPGRGKRGGVRTLVATRLPSVGSSFTASATELSDISGNALRGFQELAKELLGFDERELAIAVAAGELLELKREQDKSKKSDVRGAP